MKRLSNLGLRKLKGHIAALKKVGLRICETFVVKETLDLTNVLSFGEFTFFEIAAQ